MAKPVGRPTKYSEEMLAKTDDYIKNHLAYGDPVPIAAGLACELDVNKDTLYAWGKKHEEFSDMLKKLNSHQERKLVRGGLNNEFNPTINKLMLAKQGYSDKVEQDVTSSDGSMTQPTKIELIGIKPDGE